MKFDTPKTIKFTQILGYIGMYLIFTAILFFILSYTERIPQSWTIFHVSLISLMIVLTGRLINLLLK